MLEPVWNNKKPLTENPVKGLIEIII